MRLARPSGKRAGSTFATATAPSTQTSRSSVSKARSTSAARPEKTSAVRPPGTSSTSRPFASRWVRSAATSASLAPKRLPNSSGVSQRR